MIKMLDVETRSRVMPLNKRLALIICLLYGHHFRLAHRLPAFGRCLGSGPMTPNPFRAGMLFSFVLVVLLPRRSGLGFKG